MNGQQQASQQPNYFPISPSNYFLWASQAKARIEKSGAAHILIVNQVDSVTGEPLPEFRAAIDKYAIAKQKALIELEIERLKSQELPLLQALIEAIDAAQ